MENFGKEYIDAENVLNFSLPSEEEDEDDDKSSSNTLKFSSSSSSYSSLQPVTTCPDELCGSSSLSAGSYEEEELEWILDKNAFPSLDTCPDIVKLDPQSPKSVLENSTTSSGNGHSSGDGSSIMSCCQGFLPPAPFTVGKRSKRRRTGRKEGFGNLPGQHLSWWNKFSVEYQRQELAFPSLPTAKTNSRPSIGRKCLHCGADKTPQWRMGPMGPKTLCNACGVRFKSGRLVPEYRPASSPTFSAAIHSNSHRKIIKMRKEKQQKTGIDGVNGNNTSSYNNRLW